MFNKSLDGKLLIHSSINIIFSFRFIKSVFQKIKIQKQNFTLTLDYCKYV